MFVHSLKIRYHLDGPSPLCIQLQVIIIIIIIIIMTIIIISIIISRTQLEYCLLFISKITLLKNDYMFRPLFS